MFERQGWGGIFGDKDVAIAQRLRDAVRDYGHVSPDWLAKIEFYRTEIIKCRLLESA